MGFKFEAVEAVREKVSVRVGISGAPGSGKSYSSLTLATGMCKELGVDPAEKILVLGTEGDRDLYYANQFKYKYIPLSAPFTPEMYAAAIEYGNEQGFEVIIIDSSTPEWDEVKRIHDAMSGNSFTNWGKVKVRHKKFIDALLASKAHIICCMRSKVKHEQTKNEKGYFEVKKLGLESQQDGDIEYEMTVAFTLQQDTHIVDSNSKDNTGLFTEKYDVVTENDGRALIRWANEGSVPIAKPKVVETPPTLKEKSPKVHDAFQKLPPEATEKALKDAGLNVIDDLVSKTRDEALAIYAAAQGYAKEGGGSE